MNRPMQCSLTVLFLASLSCATRTPAQETPKQQAMQMDVNLDGTLSADEHEAGVDLAFDTLDADQDNFITADELEVAREARGSRSTASSTEGIAVLDIDRDGRLSETEHAAGAKGVFKEADASRDGNLSPEEIKAADDAARVRVVTP